MATAPNANPVTFGDLLRRHRLAAGLTQEELAERARMSARGISDLERGARTRPQRETRTLLADALGLAGPQRDAFLAAIRPGVSGTRSAMATGRLGQASQHSRHASLPVPANALIGRTAELVTATALLRDPAVRLLTLTGAGGSGKTRLAIETANQLQTDFPDGAFFVDLAPLMDPALVLRAIAGVCGVREHPGHPLLEAVTEALIGRRILLILDNFEHLLSAAPVVSTLLSAVPEAKILVTSRARLALTGEQELSVPPLAVPDPGQRLSLEQMGQVAAVRLFVSRARNLQPGFVLTEESAPVIAAICQRLDGLPLAIELAAARIKLLPPHALLNRLQRALPLLIGGARDLPARQQTLRNTIAWSYALLADDERALFRRLGVFVGGWTLEAAERIANMEGTLDVLEGLSSLIDKSLVRQIEHADDEPRYAMLETIREFAVAALAESTEESSVRDAHAAYFPALAQRAEPGLSGPDQIAWLNQLQAEHPNLRAALDWLQQHGRLDTALQMAAALRWFWIRRGHVGEGWDQLSTLLDAPTAAHEPGWARAAAVAALLARWRQDRTRAEELFGVAISQLRERDDRAGLAMALCGHSDVAVDSDDCDRAEGLAREALLLAHELGDHWLIALATNHLGNIAAVRLNFSLAATIWEETLRLFRATGDTTYICQSLGNVGWAALDLDDPGRALQPYREQLALATQVGDPWWLAWGVKGVARMAAISGDPARAARLFASAAAQREALGVPLRPAVQRKHDRVVAGVERDLGPVAFTAAWEAGQSLPIEEAAAEALPTIDQLANTDVAAFDRTTREQRPTRSRGSESDSARSSVRRHAG